MVSVLDILPRRPSGGDYKLLFNIKTAVLLFVTLAGNLPHTVSASARMGRDNTVSTELL